MFGPNGTNFDCCVNTLQYFEHVHDIILQEKGNTYRKEMFAKLGHLDISRHYNSPPCVTAKWQESQFPPSLIKIDK